ncbi:MAG TPA: CvpA family protein [Lacipirellulaceae bacterium]|nr:CvpA family protein [Lacipirellulaceae bacterium]
MLMLVVLVGATLFGFWKGMAWQLASLASLVVSYFVSLRFGEQLAPLFGQQAPWNKFVAMFAIYVGTSLVVWMLFRLVSDLIDKVKLESFDRQLGGMFGFAKGVLLCIGITFFAVTLWPAQGQAIVDSQSGHYIVALLDKAHSVFPPEVHQVVDPYLNKIEQKLNPNYQPHGQDMRPQWPAQGQADTPATTPQDGWPQPQQVQQQTNWPAPSQPAWPVQTQQRQPPSSGEANSAPREPNTFPGPYSAEVPTSRPY